MFNKKSDTICALATPEGHGALGIVRMSGPLAHIILHKIFRRPFVLDSNVHLDLKQVYYGNIYDGERVIDEVLVHLAVAAASFTGEDTAEVSCHGSPYIEQEILKLMIQEGARPAQAGEFSMRAFLHGKMDLSQAEAIADLIASENESAHRLALQQMRGGYSQALGQLRTELLDVASLMELELDFSEEDVAFADRSQLLELLNKIQQHIQRLCDSFALGNVLKNGVPVAIVGPTNAGKSTLLNALLGEERAIVSNIHGTTRDTIEEVLNVGGMQFRFIDTAGLRETSELIEQMGIERSLEKIRAASLLFVVLDAGHPERFAAQISKIAQAADIVTKQIIFILNKSEKFSNKGVVCNNAVASSDTIVTNELKTLLASILKVTEKYKLLSCPIIAMSAKYKIGIEALQSLLVSTVQERFPQAPSAQNTILVSNLRHLQALQEAQKALDRVREGLSSTLSTDLITQDIREALYHIGSITGDISTDEILGNIFGKFCIGK